MNAALEPAEYTVDELHDAIAEVDEPDTLSTLLEAEMDGKDRKTAIEAIEERLETISDDDTGDTPPQDTTAPAPEDEDGSPSSTAEADNEAAASAPTSAQEPDPGWAVDDLDPADGTGEIDAAATALGLAVPEEAEDHPGEGAPEAELNQRLLSNLVKIRSTLEDMTGRGGSYEARIRQLQAEISDLKAYTSALEEFLDEEGTGQHVVESVRQDLAAITDEVENLEMVITRHARRLDQHDDRLESLDDDVAETAAGLESHRDLVAARQDDVDDRFDAVETTLAAHDDVHGELDDRLQAVNDEADSIATAVDDLETALDDEAESRTALEDRVGTLADTVDELSADIDAITSEVSALDRAVGDSGRIDQRFAAIEDELAALKEWRDQLGSAMLGGGGQSDEE